MNEAELMILRVQAAQARESMEGCPGTCFAARFLRDYVRLFNLFEKLERRIDAIDNWDKTVEENNEAR